MMTMVGDAYAAPLVEELRSGSYDLSSMFAIGTGGAATNPKHQRALLELLPQITLINGYGSSETGNVGFGRSQRGDEKDTFVLREGALVLSEDYTRFLDPGEDEIGFVARCGSYPAGLLRRRGGHPQDVSCCRRPARGDLRGPRFAGPTTALCDCSDATRLS